MRDCESVHLPISTSTLALSGDSLRARLRLSLSRVARLRLSLSRVARLLSTADAMPTNTELKAIMRSMQDAAEAHHNEDGSDKSPAPPKVQRGQPASIAWQSFNVDMQLVPGDDGTTLKIWRTKYKEHDAILGEAITSGRHEWTVRAPNGNANNYCGVAVENCDKRIYPAGTSAWAMYLHDGDLCSGVAARPKKSLGFTRPDGTRGYMEAPGASTRGNGAKNPLWAKRVLQPIARGTPITVILDMEERTLSFAIGDEEPKLGFTNLPAMVHPYLCSGDAISDGSVVEVGATPSGGSLLEIGGGGAHTVKEVKA